MHGRTAKVLGDGQKGLENSGRFGYHNEKKQALRERMARLSVPMDSVLLINILSAPATSLGQQKEKKLRTNLVQ